MAKSQHIIELNGQKYDALTGKIIGPSHVAKTAAKAVKQTPKHVDGFVRRPGATAAKPKQRTPAPATKAVHKQPAKSQTLMRKAVQQPAPRNIHAKATPAELSESVPQQSSTTLFDAIRPGRAIRAANVAQSSLISKFGRGTPTIKSEVVPVAPMPSSHPATHKKPQSVKPAPAKSTAATQKPHLKEAVAKADPFRQAVEQAISHEQVKPKKLRAHHKIAKKLRVSPRLVSFMGVTLLALGVGGFLAYQNLPELAMRVASTRAGLNATLPSYQPAGYAMSGPIEYEPGSVKVNYKSNTDSRAFNVTQKNSSWNSETLLQNYVSTTNQPYQTFQANGRTIYIYDGNKATWVDGGVWYDIDGQTNLNSDQLLRIAESL